MFWNKRICFLWTKVFFLTKSSISGFPQKHTCKRKNASFFWRAPLARVNWTLARADRTLSFGLGGKILWHPYCLGWPNIFSEKKVSKIDHSVSLYNEMSVKKSSSESNNSTKVLLRNIFRKILEIDWPFILTGPQGAGLSEAVLKNLSNKTTTFFHNFLWI